jgi:hypothetical protein
MHGVVISAGQKPANRGLTSMGGAQKVDSNASSLRFTVSIVSMKSSKRPQSSKGRHQARRGKYLTKKPLVKPKRLRKRGRLEREQLTSEFLQVVAKLCQACPEEMKILRRRAKKSRLPRFVGGSALNFTRAKGFERAAGNLLKDPKCQKALNKIIQKWRDESEDIEKVPVMAEWMAPASGGAMGAAGFVVLLIIAVSLVIVISACEPGSSDGGGTGEGTEGGEESGGEGSGGEEGSGEQSGGEGGGEGGGETGGGD